MHLDGAKFSMWLVETGEKHTNWDNILIVFPFAFPRPGSPVGSVLTGTKEFIAKARKSAEGHGRRMRQAGYLACCGIYALDHHMGDLKRDK